jgi:hypothetical protein
MLQVIGAGFGRTGTLSLKAALEALGFGPCYHMYELLGHIDHAQFWVAAEAGDPAALRTPLAGYRATVDWPGCVFWRELCDLYPEAKVVLSVRPPGRWYDSFRETVGAVLAAGAPADVPEVFAPVFEMSDRIVRDRSFGPGFDVEDADAVIAAYQAHNESVREGVASHRLLEFDVSQGWSPLCAFLGVPIPDTEFPNVNDREQFRQLFGLGEPLTEVTEADVHQAQARFAEAARYERPGHA